MEEKSKFFTSENIAVLGILAAFVVVLQIFGSYFKIGAVQFSFVLVPIVLGSILTGAIGGAILGFLFGLITLIMGIVGVDQFTFILFSDHPFLTILTCIVKATAAGYLSGLIYSLVSKKNKTAAVFSAAAICIICLPGSFTRQWAEASEGLTRGMRAARTTRSIMSFT